jgi:hypothetical protein
MVATAPLVRSVPEYATSVGEEALELAATAGLHLDEWQSEILTAALGRRDDGKWAAFEVGVVVPRQNGKGSLLEARELAGLFLLEERLIIHSAHQFDTSLEAFRRLLWLIEDTPSLEQQVQRVSRSHGEEGIELKNGCRIRFRTRTKGGGRGFTGDTLILDEAMVLPDSFVGALLPTLSARSVTGNPQVWYTGSAVDQMVHEHGTALARVRERGVNGDARSLAYFEFAADLRGDDGETVELSQVDLEMLENPGLWAQANPGLGIRISEEHVANELRSPMGARGFAVERLGIGDWPATHTVAGQVISVADWSALADEESTVVDPVCFAFDVKPDRSSASIAVAGLRADGLRHVEVVDRQRGTGWVAPRLAELTGRHDAIAVVCDPYGPAGSLVHEIEDAGVEVQTVTAREHADACGLIFDLVDQKGLRHRGQGELAAAVKAATRRPLGDAWAWSRKGGVDISPLVAGTLALWGASTIETDEAWVGSW